MKEEKQKKKGGCLKWAAIIIGVLILFGACTAAFSGGGDTSTTEDSETASSETSTEETTEEATKEESEETTEEETAPEAQEYSVGDTADIDGKQITVTNVEKRQPGEFEVVKEGYEFVIINLDIVNGSDEEINYNALNFELQDGNGNITDTFGTVSLDGVGEQLSSGALAPGGNVSGTVVFEVPKGDEDLTLRYKDNMFSNETVDFNLY
ncbi:DUF4352 domain-containing protein [Salinicoccus sp. HZC-1]|uniref:DUF4352 domain-containing protein n=1 Tax=Salinicoccus sp. HZC-1 TaxID=3385497 RepID=UPI00398B2659